MKKMFSLHVMIVTCALMTVSLFSYGEILSENFNTDYQLAIATHANAYSVRCCKLTRQGSVWIKKQCSGTYDADANTLTVDGNTYYVQNNPDYGEDTTPGRYQYRAGSYYFNL